MTSDCSLRIVIVNWNSGHRLRDCLDALGNARIEGFQLLGVTVVDNDSSDGSFDDLPEVSFDLDLVANAGNAGFAAACNQGAMGDEDYLLFLNPDTRISPDALGLTIDFMQRKENSGIGICGARMTSAGGQLINSCSRFPTPAIFFGKASGLCRIAPGLFPTHLMTPQELDRSRPVDQVIGAYFMVRGQLFRELGGFDERFFVYFEEVDFSLRAARAGFSSYFLREAIVYHDGGACAGTDPASRLFYSLRSRLLFGNKHFTPAGLAALTATTFAVELPARLVSALMRRSASDAAATAQGYGMLLRSLPSIRPAAKP